MSTVRFVITGAGVLAAGCSMAESADEPGQVQEEIKLTRIDAQLEQDSYEPSVKVLISRILLNESLTRLYLDDPEEFVKGYAGDVPVINVAALTKAVVDLQPYVSPIAAVLKGYDTGSMVNNQDSNIQRFTKFTPDTVQNQKKEIYQGTNSQWDGRTLLDRSTGPWVDALPLLSRDQIKLIEAAGQLENGEIYLADHHTRNMAVTRLLGDLLVSEQLRTELHDALDNGAESLWLITNGHGSCVDRIDVNAALEIAESKSSMMNGTDPDLVKRIENTTVPMWATNKDVVTLIGNSDIAAVFQ